MPTRGGKTTGERGKKMRTYELKYSRSLGSFVELKQDLKVVERISYRGYDKQQHKKYQDLGYTEKVSDIIRIMRETLQDAQAGEHLEVLKTICNAIK